MDRRTYLRTLAGGAGLGLAGCLGGFETQSAWRDPPIVEDRPDGIYVPAISEGMGHYGTVEVGRYRVALLYSYPHRFWTLAGRERSKTVVEAKDSVHLMAAVWDGPTGVVVPAGSLSAEVTRGGELVAQEVVYPMLSQRMGFHYGSNFALDGEGEYTAALTIGGLEFRRSGAFEALPTDARTAEIPFTFETGELHDLSLTRLGERGGERGALAPMDAAGGMAVPVGRAPAPDALPGTHLGRTRTGDLVFEVCRLDEPERFGAEGETYLAVSARTRYNGIVVPMTGLAVDVDQGDTTTTYDLSPGLDPDLHYHYGTGLPALGTGGTLTFRVTTPPQVARHDGYETAFTDPEPARLRV